MQNERVVLTSCRTLKLRKISMLFFLPFLCRNFQIKSVIKYLYILSCLKTKIKEELGIYKCFYEKKTTLRRRPCLFESLTGQRFLNLNMS
jgi:hypothetical protein